MISAPGWIKTVMTPGSTFGASAVAVIVAEPVDTAVKLTLTEAVWAAKVTVEGAVATAVLLDLKLTVNPPAGAGAERVRVMFCAPVPLNVIAAGEKLITAPTCTTWLAEV
jgi:hypothetical protein